MHSKVAKYDPSIQKNLEVVVLPNHKLVFHYLSVIDLHNYTRKRDNCNSYLGIFFLSSWRTFFLAVSIAFTLGNNQDFSKLLSMNQLTVNVTTHRVFSKAQVACRFGCCEERFVFDLRRH